MTIARLRGVAAAALLAAAVPLHAPAAEEPGRLVALSAAASREVAQDLGTVRLALERESADPATLTAQAQSTLDEALQAARSFAKVEARSGAFRTWPVADRDGRITTWRVRAELTLSSRDFAELSRAAGTLATKMPVSSVAFTLSPEARREAEDALLAQAIAAFKARAEAVAQAFGAPRYELFDAQVSASSEMPPPMMRGAAMMAAETKAAPLPIAGGSTHVEVGVNGRIRLER